MSKATDRFIPVEQPPDEKAIAIALGLLHENSWDTRQLLDDAKLAELAASIKSTNGVIQPAIVRPWPGPGGDSFEIVAGRRRFRASKLAGMTHLRCIVRELDDEQAKDVTAIENIQREDLTPLEEAKIYQRLMDRDPSKNTPVELAARFGKTESHIYRRLKLFSLIPALLDALEEGRLDVSHAERLARLTSEQQRDAAGIDEKGNIDGRDGVVWKVSPLFDGDGYKPGIDDLEPVWKLDEYLRTKAFFNPRSEDVRHFQPALAEEIQTALTADLSNLPPEDERRSDEPTNEDMTKVMLAQLVELTTDPLIKSRVGAEDGAALPLTPSKWKEIGPKKKDRCEFVRRGVIVHGSASRVVEICIEREKCRKHWPEPKKAPKPAAASNGSEGPAKTPARPQHEIDAEKRAIAEKAWAALRPLAVKGFVAHVVAQPVTAGLVQLVLNDFNRGSLRTVKDNFGVTLGPKNVGQVLALSTVKVYSREGFLESVKPFKFTAFGSIEQKHKAAIAKAAEKKPAKSAKYSKAAKSKKAPKKGKR